MKNYIISCHKQSMQTGLLEFAIPITCLCLSDMTALKKGQNPKLEIHNAKETNPAYIRKVDTVL